MSSDHTILILCTVNLIQCMSQSLFAPFYPLEVVEKGIDTVWIGFFIGIFAFTYIFSSFITGRFLRQIGRARALKIGLIMLTLQLFFLASVYWIDHESTFLTLSFVAQVCGGIGNGLITTTSIAILTSQYTEERQKVMGIFETATGVGYLVGPMIGSGLFKLGGYLAAFYGMCGINIILYPFMAWTANQVDQQLQEV